MSKNNKNTLKYDVVKNGVIISGWMTLQNFKISCRWCKNISNCGKRYIEPVLNISIYRDGIDDSIKLNFEKNEIRDKKYYCCSKCLKFCIDYLVSPNIKQITSLALIDSFHDLFKNNYVIPESEKESEIAKKYIKELKQEEKLLKSFTQNKHNQRWGKCPICYASVKKERKRRNKEKYYVIANHFSQRMWCSGSELSWEKAIKDNSKEKYKIAIEDITDGKL